MFKLTCWTKLSSFNPETLSHHVHTQIISLGHTHTLRDCTFPNLCNQSTFSFPACIKDWTAEADKYIFASEEEDKHLFSACAKEKESDYESSEEEQ